MEERKEQEAEYHEFREELRKIGEEMAKGSIGAFEKLAHLLAERKNDLSGRLREWIPKNELAKYWVIYQFVFGAVLYHFGPDSGGFPKAGGKSIFEEVVANLSRFILRFPDEYGWFDSFAQAYYDFGRLLLTIEKSGPLSEEEAVWDEDPAAD